MQHVFAQAETAADIVVVAQARFTPPLKNVKWKTTTKTARSQAKLAAYHVPCKMPQEIPQETLKA